MWLAPPLPPSTSTPLFLDVPIFLAFRDQMQIRSGTNLCNNRHAAGTIFSQTMEYLWYLYQLVTRSMLRMCEGKEIFVENSFKFPTVLDLNKCLKHIKLPISLQCAYYKLPPIISSMEYGIFECFFLLSLKTTPDLTKKKRGHCIFFPVRH